MSDQPPVAHLPEAQMQTWNRPPPLKPAGPLQAADTIAVTRNGVTVPVPLSVIAAYLANAIAAQKAGNR